MILNIHKCFVDIEPNSFLPECGFSGSLLMNRIQCVALDGDFLLAFALGSPTLGESCCEDTRMALGKHQLGDELKPLTNSHL